MGACSSKQPIADDSRPIQPQHKEVELITTDKVQSSKPLGSIAVFGSYDSGKSTLVRKLYLLYGESYNKAERDNFRKTIDATILDGTLTLLHAFLELHPPQALPMCSPLAQPLALNLSQDPDNIIFEESHSPLASAQPQQFGSIACPTPQLTTDPSSDPGQAGLEPDHPMIKQTNPPFPNMGRVSPTLPAESSLTPSDIPEDLILGPGGDNDDTLPPLRSTGQAQEMSTSRSSSSAPGASGLSSLNAPQLTSLQQVLQNQLPYYLQNPQYLTTYENPSDALLTAIYTLLQLENDLFQSTAPYGVIHPFVNRQTGAGTGLVSGHSTSGPVSDQQRPSFLANSFTAKNSGGQIGLPGTPALALAPFLLLQGHPITPALARDIITIWSHPVFRYIYQHSHMLYKASPIMNNTVHVNNNNNSLVMLCEGYLQRVIAAASGSSRGLKGDPTSPSQSDLMAKFHGSRRQSTVKQMEENSESHPIVQDIDLLLMKTTHYHPIRDSFNDLPDNKSGDGQVSLYEDQENSSHIMDEEGQPLDNPNAKPSPLTNFQFEPYDRYVFETDGFEEVTDFFQNELAEQENNYLQTIRQAKDFNTPFSDVFRKFVSEQIKAPSVTGPGGNNFGTTSRLAKLTAQQQPATSPTSPTAPGTDQSSHLDNPDNSKPSNVGPGFAVNPDHNTELQQSILRTNSTLGPECYLAPELYSLDNIEEPKLAYQSSADTSKQTDLRRISEDQLLGQSNSDQYPVTPTKNRGSISFRAVTAASPRSSSKARSSSIQARSSSIQARNSGSVNQVTESPGTSQRLLRPSSAQNGKQEGMSTPLLKQPAYFSAINEGNNENATPSVTNPDEAVNVATSEPPVTPEVIKDNQSNETGGLGTPEVGERATTPILSTDPAMQPQPKPTTPSQTSLAIYDCAGSSRGQNEWQLVMKRDVKLIYYIVSLTEFLNASSVNHYGFAAEQTGRGRGSSNADLVSEGDFPRRGMGSPATTNTSFSESDRITASPSTNTSSLQMNSSSATGGPVNKYFVKPDIINRYVRKNVMLFTKTLNSTTMNHETEIIVVFSKYDLLVKHLAHQKQLYLQQQYENAATNGSNSSQPTPQSSSLASPFASNIHQLPNDRPHLILFNDIFPQYTGDNFDPYEVAQFLVDLYLAKLILQSKDVHVVAPQSGLVYLQNSYRNSSNELNLNSVANLESLFVEQAVEKPKTRRKTIFTFDLDEDQHNGADNQGADPNTSVAQPEQPVSDPTAEAQHPPQKEIHITDQQKALLKQEILIRDTFDCGTLYLDPISRLIDRHNAD